MQIQTHVARAPREKSAGRTITRLRCAVASSRPIGYAATEPLSEIESQPMQNNFPVLLRTQINALISEWKILNSRRMHLEMEAFRNRRREDAKRCVSVAFAFLCSERARLSLVTHKLTFRRLRSRAKTNNCCVLGSRRYDNRKSTADCICIMQWMKLYRANDNVMITRSSACARDGTRF